LCLVLEAWQFRDEDEQIAERPLRINVIAKGRRFAQALNRFVGSAKPDQEMPIPVQDHHAWQLVLIMLQGLQME
jgi:hypothetical protein